jgi:hypothetical protein
VAGKTHRNPGLLWNYAFDNPTSWNTLSRGRPLLGVSLCNGMKQISYGKQRETKNSTPEIQVVTNAVLEPQCIQGNRRSASET